MQIYIDGAKAYEVKGATLNTALPLAVGTHRLTVQAYNGAFFKTTESITVVSSSSVQVSPGSTLVAPGATQQFTARVQNISPSTVTWSVDGVTGGNATLGTISSSGLYTAPATGHRHVIAATSTANPAISAASTLLVQAPISVSVLTYHNDPQRTGQNLNETSLTPANVNATQFGKAFSLAVDGEVYAQPLYVSNMSIAGGRHNVVFLATEHDTVYAFDADGLTPNPLWQTSLLSVGTTSYPESTTNSGISYELGVTGTPVIDLSTGTLYVVDIYKSPSTGKNFAIHALDITTGAEKLGGPKVIPSSALGDLTVNVSKSCYQRTGIALSNGTLYFGFAHGGYHGWVLAYSASTLAPVGLFTTTPNGAHGGVWMSGAPPSVETDGSVYFSTADGTFDINTGGTDFGDSFVHASLANGQFNVEDYFTPYNESYLYSSDADLGSGGLLMLPTNNSAHPHEIFGGGKQSYVYLVDRDTMGKFHSQDNSQAVNYFRVAGTGIHSTPAYWNGYVYLHPESSVLTQYAYANGMITSSAVAQGSSVYSLLGASPSISANGNSSGIVWELSSDAYEPGRGAAILEAHDASNVSVLLYSSSQAGTRDTAGPAVKFAVPTVANGHVYVGGRKQVTVYGLLGN